MNESKFEKYPTQILDQELDHYPYLKFQKLPFLEISFVDHVVLWISLVFR